MSASGFEGGKSGWISFDLTKTRNSPSRQAELATYAATFEPLFTAELRELIVKAKAEGRYSTELVKVTNTPEGLEEITEAMVGVKNNLNNFDGAFYWPSSVSESDEGNHSYTLRVSWYPEDQSMPLDHPRRGY